MFWGLSVRPSVRPSVTSFFSRTVHSIFLKFCMKVSIHKEKKRTFSFFLGNFSFGPQGAKWGPKLQKLALLTPQLLIHPLDFSETLQKVKQH